MLSASDAGTEVIEQAQPALDSATTVVTPPPLVPGSIEAKALYELWTGKPLVIVDSPPGAGKTRLVCGVVAHIAQRTTRSMCVATATRKQAVSLAARLSDFLPASSIYLGVNGLDPDDIPAGVLDKSTASTAQRNNMRVRIRTVASCRFSPDHYDVMVVDEAYQSTLASIAIGAQMSDQLLLVGDPGQIGPVVTCDTSTWEHRRMAPHVPAPSALSRSNDASLLNLNTSFRLGPATVEAIAPLYAFEFSSSRPDRHLEGDSRYAEIESIRVPEPQTPYDPDLLQIVANRAAEFVGATLVDRNEGSSRPLEPTDIGVVVSHNAQSSTLAAMLRSRGLEGITVGTADRLQGGEWHAVVSVDPLCGHEEMSPHALSLGRLCVMASRHRTHLTWVHDGTWGTTLDDGATSVRIGRVGRLVRERLCK